MIAVRQYETAGEIISGAKAVRMRLMPAPVKTKADPALHIVTMTETHQPRPHDAHLFAYYEWKTNEPVGYLKMRCRELNVAYSDVTAPRGNVGTIRIKDKLVREIREKYPRLSTPAIGRVFGGRDHTTILHSLNKGKEVQLSAAEMIADEITRLRAHGFRQFQIVELTGLKKSQINHFFISRGWTRPRGEKGQDADGKQNRT